MNKQYIVDSEGNVNVITDNGETIEFGIYNKYTEAILSLENYSEEITKKVHIFDKTIKEITKKIRNKNKINRMFNITLTIIITILLIISAIISSKLFLLVALSIIPISIITGIIENKLLTKDKEEERFYSKKYTEENHRLNKIKNKIETLKKDKTKVNLNNINRYIDIKPIENYNLDPGDYYIEKYQIEKRTREMTKSKTKKIVRTKNIANTYKI